MDVALTKKRKRDYQISFWWACA